MGMDKCLLYVKINILFTSAYGGGANGVVKYVGPARSGRPSGAGQVRSIFEFNEIVMDAFHCY